MRDGDKIKFVIEDVATRRYLDSVLKHNYLYSDTSWNTEVVVITPKSLATILDELLSSNDASMVKDKISQAKSKHKKVTLLKGLENLLCSIVGGAAKDVVSMFVNEFSKKIDQ